MDDGRKMLALEKMTVCWKEKVENVYRGNGVCLYLCKIFVCEMKWKVVCECLDGM